MNRSRQTFIKDNLTLRATVLQGIRAYFADHGYLEVETPIRIPAPAPEGTIDAEISGEWFLQTSPELLMKRLLSSGHSRIFQICKCFRQAERGSRHLPEFTMLEWYCSKSNYIDMMAECEALIRFVASRAGLEDFILYQGETIDLRLPWIRMPVVDAFNKFASTTIEKALEENRFDEVMVLEIEPFLRQKKPLFLYDYPAERGALAKLKPLNERFAQRFELYMGGLELCNAFTELTDPDEQRARFKKEISIRRDSGKLVYPMPEHFLKSLKYMPDASGNALGIDRLVMLFCDTTRIDDIVAFTPEEL